MSARERWRRRVSLVADRAPIAGPVPVPVTAARPGDVAAKAAVLRRLELDIRRLLDGVASGDRLTAALGPGSEPADARNYGPGDDARRIDWKLTARSLQTQVRTTYADRELETWVVADCSASMSFGTAHREKREAALAAVAAFGVLTLRGGNRLGVVVAGGERTRRLPARTGRRALFAAMSAVYDAPRVDGAPAPGADLTSTLTALQHATPRRGQIVVVSDFLDAAASPDEWAIPLRRLAARHEVVAVHVTDPREFVLPPVGMVLVRDVESGRELHLQTRDAALRLRYAERAEQRRQAIADDIRHAGAAYVELSTDGDWLREILRFAARHRVGLARVGAVQ